MMEEFNYCYINTTEIKGKKQQTFIFLINWKFDNSSRLESTVFSDNSNTLLLGFVVFLYDDTKTLC